MKKVVILAIIMFNVSLFSQESVNPFFFVKETDMEAYLIPFKYHEVFDSSSIKKENTFEYSFISFDSDLLLNLFVSNMVLDGKLKKRIFKTVDIYESDKLAYYKGYPYKNRSVLILYIK